MYKLYICIASSHNNIASHKMTALMKFYATFHSNLS